MSTYKYIDRVCAAVLVLTLLLALLFVNGEALLGLRPASKAMGYEDWLFDTARVHTLDIRMDDWGGFLETCEDEEYAACSVVIDGEACKNVGLRAKGNTSLSMVSAMDSRRYSFKIEFDQYDSGKTWHGLDKLCLNNVIQDNTYLKDYLTYRMMGAFGVAAPLCSFVFVTVNGEDWGLYLAVEGVEDSFLQRNYGRDHGSLYKPDSTGFGGGRGNGRDFDMEDLGNAPEAPDGAFGNPPQMPGDGPGEMPEQAGGRPEGELPDFKGGPMHGGFGGMGSGDVKLQYTDDDPDSYPNIFSNAKTEVTEADRQRLIQALKALSEGGDLESAVDIDRTLRYFVVHNYVVNGDSYTGSMVHNYYLYEEDGRLSMIPWDYNLAFGTFQARDASTAVNDPIDSPLSVDGSGDRPMADWIFRDEAYTELYHQYFAEFLETVDPAALIEEAGTLIAPYVERDPTKFCAFQEFETGVQALKDFCRLRSESVSGQLAGTIPSTAEGQSAGASALVDAGELTLSDQGTMNRGGNPGGRGRSNGAANSGEPAPLELPEARREAAERTAGPPAAPGEGGNPGEAPGAGGVSGEAVFVFGISMAVLLAGILAAFLYRRRGR